MQIWPYYRNRLASLNADVSEIDLTREDGFGVDITRLPEEIRRNLVSIPQVFALYSDGFVEFLQNSPNLPAGRDELEAWATRGPPRFNSYSDGSWK